MSDRICPCGKSFIMPYLLKRHQNSKLGCIPYLMSLNAQHSVIHTEHKEEGRERAKAVKEFFCKFCNRKLASKFSMERHHTTCSKNEDNKIKNDISDITNNAKLRDLFESIANTVSNNQGEWDIKIGELSIKYSPHIPLYNDIQTNPTSSSNSLINKNFNISKLKFNNDTITLPDNNNIQNNVGNTSNISNTYASNVKEIIMNANNSTNATINNITNNITNNNANNNANNNELCSKLPFVYPFGYENISFLTEAEVIDILKSDDGAVLVLDKIYSQIENNNFMKANKKDKHMMYINSPDNITYCSDKEFINKLFEQSKLLLQRVYFQYYERLTPKYQHIVLQNIQQVNDILDTKPYLLGEKYKYIVAKKTNNAEEKKTFNEIKKGIDAKDKLTIKENTKAFNKSSSQIMLLNEELNKSSLNMEDINKIWEQLHTDETISYNNFLNDLTLHRFEDTPRFKLIQTLLKNELEYKYKQNYKFGDLYKFYDYIKLRMDCEIEYIKHSFPDISEEYMEEIKNLLIIKPFENAQIDLLGLQRLLPQQKNNILSIS
jgi:hypothetical protein